MKVLEFTERGGACAVMLAFGDYIANAYLCFGQGCAECALIDAGGHASEILAEASARGLRITDILLTHGHYDHIGAVAEIIRATGACVTMNPADAGKIGVYGALPAGDYRYAAPFVPDEATADGKTVRVGGVTFGVLHTPGHSEGSVCYTCGDFVFCGDLLLENSYGRVDFEDGNLKKIVRSIKRIFALEDDRLLLCGHGAPMTLDAQRQYNDILTEPEFCRCRIVFRAEGVSFAADFAETVRSFGAYLDMEEDPAAADDVLTLRLENCAEGIKCIITSLQFPEKNSEKILNLEQYDDITAEKRQLKRMSKAALYAYLSDYCGVRLPYGSLTGIRPTKLFRELSDAGEDAERYLTERLLVSAQKTRLLGTIVEAQRPYLAVAPEELDLFINVPLCPSRCAYCSFLSAQIDKVKGQVDAYCDLLAAEVAAACELFKESRRLRCIYVGGGTPTALSAAQLARVLAPLAGFSAQAREFTLEAGRPDSIDADKLRVLKDLGVTRISVNPQSFLQRTLDVIGRRHSVAEIYRAYELARAADFDVNMDLIAALPGESAADFRYSLDCAAALTPDNITVHTLCLKRGSALKVGGYDVSASAAEAAAMTDYAYEKLTSLGYAPYYLYRQKYASGNLENIGYAKPGKICVYNIDIMEETTSVAACGAGGISKRVAAGGARIERLANPKGLDVFLARGMEIARKKAEFFGRISEN